MSRTFEKKKKKKKKKIESGDVKKKRHANK